MKEHKCRWIFPVATCFMVAYTAELPQAVRQLCNRQEEAHAHSDVQLGASENIRRW